MDVNGWFVYFGCDSMKKLSKEEAKACLDLYAAAKMILWTW